MSDFLNDDFMLTTDVARELYHNYAKQQPIIDYHCHLIPQEILDNKNFETITDIWLGGDHYKWRLMRANGVDEELITGKGDKREKFRAFAACLEKAPLNPIFEWSHLELKRFFGIDKILNTQTADEIFDEANELLAKDEFKPRSLIARMKVEAVCTTDDPIDDLEVHKQIAQVESRFKVLPAWRPDKLVNCNKEDFNEYIEKLEAVCGYQINTFTDLCQAIDDRIKYFDERGSKLSDHGLDFMIYEKATEDEVNQILIKARKGEVLSNLEVVKYKTAVLLQLTKKYCEYGWTMQLHTSALRNISDAGWDKTGPDTGYDAIADYPIAKPLAEFLNAADKGGFLPRTILYSLNPNDWMSILSIMGGFQKGMVQKIQLGSAWWFNDTRDGMRKQIIQFGEESLLGNFVGMLTDSRSFLSYPRHEYFRRLVCEIFGEYVERGQLPNNIDALGKIVNDISYYNTKNFLMSHI